MAKVLMILEVSRKQDFIFSAKALRENTARSACISYVTDDKFFKVCNRRYRSSCPTAKEDLYNKEQNMVYAGGGHTILQFDGQTPEEAEAKAFLFAKTVSETAMRDYDGLELFAKQIPYKEAASPRENLLALLLALENKKALRPDAIRQTDFGIEKASAPRELSGRQELSGMLPHPPIGYTYPTKFDELAGEDNFIAVVHIDGNGMGGRVSGIYEKEGSSSWPSCCKLLESFSFSIQEDYENAFRSLCRMLTAYAKDTSIPIRPVVLAGDDVCFVTAGSLGLTCADYMLKELSRFSNREDGLSYTACAGVALVHKKYPFFRAYQLSEELCSNAKKFSAAKDENKRISAIDWHIEFGQLKDSLEDIRRDYITEDGDWITLRPVASVVPEGCRVEAPRSFAYFREMSHILRKNADGLARSKLKKLRNAIKQGEYEAEYYVHDNRIRSLLDKPFSAEHGENAVRVAFQMLTHRSGAQPTTLPKALFQQFGEKKHCLVFDAIELMDHCVFFKEGET